MKIGNFNSIFNTKWHFTNLQCLKFSWCFDIISVFVVNNQVTIDSSISIKHKNSGSSHNCFGYVNPDSWEQYHHFSFAVFHHLVWGKNLHCNVHLQPPYPPHHIVLLAQVCTLGRAEHRVRKQEENSFEHINAEGQNDGKIQGLGDTRAGRV